MKSKAPTAEEGPLQYIDLSAIDSRSKAITESKEIVADDAPSRARQRVSATDVLVSTVRPNLNGVAQVPAELDGAVASTGFTVLRANPELLDHRYLLHWVCGEQFISEMVRQATGASYPAVSDRIVKASRIPLPPLPEQRRIASILDQADQSVRAIESRLHLLAELESSVFFDIASRANAPSVPLADIAVTTSGGTPSRDVAEYYGPGHFWVKSGEVNQDIVLETEETITPAGLSNSSAKLMPAGTVLLAMYGATAGEVGLLGVEAATNQAVCCITPREGVSAEYLVMALKAQRATLKSLAVGGAQPNLSQGQMRTLLLPLLDSRDQARLAEATRNIRDLKNKVQAQLSTSANLSMSLRHQAFSDAL